MPQLKPFTKSSANSADLVSLLQSRGLQIDDALGAEQYLDNIGYYRLSAYMYPLLALPKEHHQYKPGSSFERVMKLYRFDKKLRLLMFNEIEKCVLEMMTEGWPRAGALTHFRKKTLSMRSMMAVFGCYLFRYACSRRDEKCLFRAKMIGKLGDWR